MEEIVPVVPETALSTDVQSTEIVNVNVISMGKNPAFIYIQSLTEKSQRVMLQSLAKIVHLISQVELTRNENAYYFDWHMIKTEHVTKIRSKINSLSVSVSTKNRHWNALRGVLKESWRLGYLSSDEYQKAVDFKPFSGSAVESSEKGRQVKGSEISRLLEECFKDNSLLGLRNATIIAIAYLSGLRRNEIVSLDVEDYKDGELLVKHGKGNKERIVPLNEDAQDLLTEWLDKSGLTSGALFVGIRKGGHITADRITDQAIYKMMGELQQTTGVKEFAPHDLRRSFAGELLDSGADLSTVQKLMGHASANTTAGYDRRGKVAKRNAISKLSISYNRNS